MVMDALTTTARGGRYIEAPATYEPHPGDGPAVFLAGGITNCPDWQAPTADRFCDAGAVVLNPRRAEWVDPARSVAASVAQVAWEARNLRRTRAVFMWFPPCDPALTQQPITMFELGVLVCSDDVQLTVGTDVDYPRACDVLLQLRHYRPGLHVHTDLDEAIADSLNQLGLT